MASKIDKARADVAKLLVAEERWRALAVEKRAELATAEGSAGGDVLDAQLAEDGDAASVLNASSRKIVILREEVETATRAADAALAKRVEAVSSVHQAEAADLRDRAAKLRRDADGRDRETTKLLTALRDHEGVEYVPDPTRRAERVGHDSGLAFDVISVAVPRTQQLRAEVAELEHQADELDARRPAVEQLGFAARGIDELLDVVAALEPTPATSTVREWAERASVTAVTACEAEGRPVVLEALYFEGCVAGGRIVANLSSARIDRYLSNEWRSRARAGTSGSA